MGKGAVHVHGLNAGTTQHRAHHGHISTIMDVVVGTALRCTAGKAVRVDRTFAHPTDSQYAACPGVLGNGIASRTLASPVT